MTRPQPRAEGIWQRRHLRVSVGAVALVFLAAMQSLAVATVMPVVSADLDGTDLYAVAFSSTLAASVVGMVGAGAWSDRRGPATPLAASVASFVAGLVVSGTAPGMEVFVLGRLLQGWGAGGVTVALYVVVARAYPASLHGRVFAAFSAAWVVPSLVGPFAAGAVAQYLHWRWVFFGVAVLAVVAFALLAGRVGELTGEPAEQRGRDVLGRRMTAAIAVALALIVLGLAGESGPLMIPLIAVSAVAVVGAVRTLLPRGTLRAARALPSVILLRGLLAGAFFGAEVYVPLYFVERHGFTPVWAGLALTVAAVTWAIFSDLQGRAWHAWADARIATLAAVLLVSSIAVVFVAVVVNAAAVFTIAAWALGAAGMGLAFPRLSVLTLAYSAPSDQGANSAALAISDAVGAAAVIAILGLLSTGVPAELSFLVVFGFAAAVALCAIIPARRIESDSVQFSARPSRQ